MEPTDDLRRDLHAVDVRLVRVETELRLHREQSSQQHDDLMSAVAGLRRDLSDQGRTPPPPPSQPSGLHEEPSVDSSSDPGAITISPKRLGPWLGLVLRAVRWVLLPALAAAGVHTCEQWPTGPVPEPAVSKDVVP